MTNGLHKDTLYNSLLDRRRRARGSLTSEEVFELLMPMAQRIDRLDAIVKAYLGPARTREIDGAEIRPPEVGG